MRMCPSLKPRLKTAPGWKMCSELWRLWADCLTKRRRRDTSSCPSSPTSRCASVSDAGEAAGRAARPAPPWTRWPAARASPATCAWCLDQVPNTTNPRSVRFNELGAFSTKPIVAVCCNVVSCKELYSVAPGWTSAFITLCNCIILSCH